MGKDCNDTLIPAETLRPDLSVADVIYYPLKTRLILDAENAGCAAAVTGIGMMLEQAAAGEKIWFDIDMPTETKSPQNSFPKTRTTDTNEESMFPCNPT